MLYTHECTEISVAFMAAALPATTNGTRPARVPLPAFRRRSRIVGLVRRVRGVRGVAGWGGNGRGAVYRRFAPSGGFIHSQYGPFKALVDAGYDPRRLPAQKLPKLIAVSTAPNTAGQRRIVYVAKSYGHGCYQAYQTSYKGYKQWYNKRIAQKTHGLLPKYNPACAAPVILALLAKTPFVIP